MYKDIFYGNTFANAYKAALWSLVYAPEYKAAPKGKNINEILNASLCIANPLECIISNPIRGTPLNYLKGELVWYLAGRNDLEFIQHFSKFWKKIANPDLTCNSAYGNLLFTKDVNNMSRWKWALDSLINDPFSRQAILHFNLPKHCYAENKDVVCTMYGNFHIRDNKLHFSVNMRSNDIKRGTIFDVPFFCFLQYIMLKQLQFASKDEKSALNSVLQGKQLQLGEFVLKADSFHLYEPDIEEACAMLANKDWQSKTLVVPNAYDNPDETLPITMQGLPQPFIQKLADDVLRSKNTNMPVTDISYCPNDAFYAWLAEG
jgi:thymidylate synthase